MPKRIIDVLYLTDIMAETRLDIFSLSENKATWVLRTIWLVLGPMVYTLTWCFIWMNVIRLTGTGTLS